MITLFQLINANRDPRRCSNLLVNHQSYNILYKVKPCLILMSASLEGCFISKMSGSLYLWSCQEECLITWDPTWRSWAEDNFLDMWAYVALKEKLPISRLPLPDRQSGSGSENCVDVSTQRGLRERMRCEIPDLCSQCWCRIVLRSFCFQHELKNGSRKCNYSSKNIAS